MHFFNTHSVAIENNWILVQKIWLTFAEETKRKTFLRDLVYKISGEVYFKNNMGEFDPQYV